MKLVGPKHPEGGPPYTFAQLAQLAMELSAADEAAKLWARIMAQRQAIRDVTNGLA